MEIKVMSINIRYDNPYDKHPWDERKHILKKTIENNQPDLIGFQEVKENQLSDLINFFSDEFDYYGQFRDATASAEMNPIFIRKSNFQMIKKDTVYLNEDRRFRNQPGFDGDCPRLFSYAILQDKTDEEKQFVFLNTHLDHVGIEARRKSVDIILDLVYDINERYQIPAIITGDFNTEPDMGYINKLLKHKDFRNSYQTLEDKGHALTIHHFSGQTMGSPIDYIFAQKPLEIKKSAIIRDNDNGVYPSDHYQVLADIELMN